MVFPCCWRRCQGAASFAAVPQHRDTRSPWPRAGGRGSGPTSPAGCGAGSGKAAAAPRDGDRWVRSSLPQEKTPLPGPVRSSRHRRHQPTLLAAVPWQLPRCPDPQAKPDPLSETPLAQGCGGIRHGCLVTPWPRYKAPFGDATLHLRYQAAPAPAPGSSNGGSGCPWLGGTGRGDSRLLGHKPD